MPIGFFGALGQQAAGQATGGAIAMGLQRLGANFDTRTMMDRQRQSMAIQMQGEKEMLDYQKQKDLETLTNSYGAQMKGLTENGLNPALMYGMQGGGAMTGGGTPSVSGGGDYNPKTAQGGNNGMAIMNAAQLALLDAQRKNIDADTANKQAENPVIPVKGENIKADTGLKIAQTGNVQADQVLKETQTKAVELANQITSASKNDQIAMFAESLDNLVQRTQEQVVKTKVAEETVKDQISTIKAQAIGAVIDNMLKDKQVTKTGVETDKIRQDIINSIKQLQLTEGGQRIEMAKAGITKMLGERGLDIAQQAVIMSAIEKVTGIIQNSTK